MNPSRSCFRHGMKRPIVWSGFYDHTLPLRRYKHATQRNLRRRWTKRGRGATAIEFAVTSDDVSLFRKRLVRREPYVEPPYCTLAGRATGSTTSNVPVLGAPQGSSRDLKKMVQKLGKSLRGPDARPGGLEGQDALPDSLSPLRAGSMAQSEAHRRLDPLADVARRDRSPHHLVHDPTPCLGRREDRRTAFGLLLHRRLWLALRRE